MCMLLLSIYIPNYKNDAFVCSMYECEMTSQASLQSGCQAHAVECWQMTLRSPIAIGSGAIPISSLLVQTLRYMEARVPRIDH